MHGPDVEAFIGLLVAVAIVATAVRIVRLPYTVALVLVGLAFALAPGAPRLQLTPTIILTVFLPVLLFHAAYNLSLADVRANLTPIALLAFPGVAATAGLIAAALHLVAGLPWETALLFGVIVGATDPVAVLGVFKEVGAPRRLATIVNAESLFNDGVALALFSVLLDIFAHGNIGVAETAQRIVVTVAGAGALGAAVGVLGSFVVSRIDDALLETTITLIMAYGGYLLAQKLEVSGALETVVAGLALGAFGQRVMSPTTRLEAGATWEFLDFLANSLLFLLVGLQLRPVGVATLRSLPHVDLWIPLIVSLVAASTARGLIVWLVGLVLESIGRPLPRGWRAIITWAGLRGAVSLAAALSLPASTPQRDLLLALTFGLVLFTLLVQGLTMQPLMARLGVSSLLASRHDLEIARGRLRAVEAAAREVVALHRDHDVDDAVAEKLDKEYAERRKDLRREIAAMKPDSGVEEKQQDVAATRRLLRVQHDALNDAFARGQLSRTSLRELLREVDDDLARLEPELEE